MSKAVQTLFEVNSSWAFGSVAGYIAQAHSGMRRAAITGTVRQVVSAPVPAGGVLSLMLRADNAEVNDQVVIQLESASQTLVLTPTLSADWQHVWADVGILTGQAITLTIETTDANAPGMVVLVDEITLGPTAVGSYPSYLPITWR